MDLLITAGQVLPGPAGQRIADGAVLVAGERIAAVGPRVEVERRAPPAVTTLRYPSGTVLPGLIDAHVHLAFDAGPDPVSTLLASDDVDLADGMAARARQLLDSGVTTVRDLGDRGGHAMRLRDAIAEGRMSGPRILAANAPLTVPGGHCWFFGGEVGDERAARDMVRRNAAAGADLIKVMVSGGHMTAGGAAMWDSQFTTDHLAAIVAQARQAGLRVAAHAHGGAAIASAVAAGVDTVEHCSWLEDGPRYRPREDVAAAMAAGGIVVCPTHSSTWRDLAALAGPRLAAELFGRAAWMDELGVPLIAGTDAGIPGAVFDDFAGSLEFFTHFGFPPGRVLEMATARAAAALGLAGTVGTLAAGFSADLLVVDGDPLADLDALRHVRLVLVKGRGSGRSLGSSTVETANMLAEG